MTIYKLFLAITGVATLSMSPALYAHQNTDYARVIGTTPVYEVQQRRHQEPLHRRHNQGPQHRGHDRHASTFIGGAIGAAVGHSISRNKHAGALIGGLIGAKIGHDVRPRKHLNNNRRHYAEHRYSEPRRILVGYDVTYRYHGQIYTTFMREHPNKRIAINTHYGQKHRHNRHHS